jgi:RNA recognition motif-containing protein
MSIYVSNLVHEVEEDDLIQIFSKHGCVKKIHLTINQKTDKEKVFAVVEMASAAEEVAAIRKLRGIKWMGRNLKVNRATTKYSIL